MFCPKCGTTNEADARFCGKCGAPLAPGVISSQSSVPQGQIPNYLVPAILTTICCCLPFGVVAIIYAAQVNGKAAAGDYNGAMEFSKNAKLWSWISFGIGLVFSILSAVVMFIGYISKGSMGGMDF